MGQQHSDGIDERTAIARLQRGDIEALEPLVRRYQHRAARLAYLITRDLDLADDLTQAAFIKAYERIGQFDARRPFGPWFLKSLTRDAIKAAQRRERHLPLPDESDDDPDLTLASLADTRPGPDLLWEQAETADEVWAALGRLAPERRALIVQRYYLGLKETELASALDHPHSTIKWRLHAARKQLRGFLRPVVTDSEGLL